MGAIADGVRRSGVRVRRVRLPEFGRVERLRLWLSFQRYPLLFAAVAPGPLTFAYLLAPEAWWAWALASLLALRLAGWAAVMAARWPRKTRALQLALHRIRIGRFDPMQVRSLCADPCFRVVAHEVLRRAGYPRRLRRQWVRALARDLHAASREHLVVDHARGQLRHTSGEHTTASLLDSGIPPPTGAPAT